MKQLNEGINSLTDNYNELVHENDSHDFKNSSAERGIKEEPSDDSSDDGENARSIKIGSCITGFWPMQFIFLLS